MFTPADIQVQSVCWRDIHVTQWIKEASQMNLSTNYQNKKTEMDFRKIKTVLTPKVKIGGVIQHISKEQIEDIFFFIFWWD